jgi:hypothetical protein
MYTLKPAPEPKEHPGVDKVIWKTPGPDLELNHQLTIYVA